MLKTPLAYAHQILKESVVKGDVVIDATVGNGNDTVLMATLVGETGKVYGFDIQKQAIQTTREKLLLTGLWPQTELILDGHENMVQYIPDDIKISAATFNLGYLPKSDKNIITQAATTIPALKQTLKLLRKGGIITIMVYYGHEGGMEEKDGVETFVHSLSQDDFHVLEYKFVNQINNPPFLYVIEKR